MPSKSPKQRRFMSIAAHNPEFAKKAGIPQSVAQEFHEADRGKSYGAGGKSGRSRLIDALRGRKPHGKYQGIPPGVAS